MRLTEHFQLAEFERSATGDKHNIVNACPLSLQGNLRLLCVNVLEPLRQALKTPIIINSGYRNDTINRLVGGTATSQHRLGEAADFKVKDLKTLQKAANYIRNNLAFDQLIVYPTFIHVSYRRFRNRGQVIIK